MRAVVARCLLKDPSRRPDAHELAARLRVVADGTSLDARAPGPSDAHVPPLRPTTRETPTTAAAAARPAGGPVVGGPVVGGPVVGGAVPRARRRWRTPLRAPALTLVALVALLLLVTLLQQTGLLGDVRGGDVRSGDVSGDPAASPPRAALPPHAHHVTGSPGSTIDEDGR